jgi:PAS domain S-box-containing protein
MVLEKVRFYLPWLKQPVILLVIACGMVLPFSSQLPTGHFFDDPVSYLPLHSALEFFSISVAILIFAIVWHTRENHEDGRSLFLASLFLGVALLDFLHVLSYMGMPAFITPSGPGKAIHFWLAARLLAAIALLGGVLWTFNQLKRSAWQFLMLICILTVVGLVSWAQLFYPEFVPVTFIPGKGLTEYKVNMEYFISLLYLIAAGLMLYKSERATQRYWLYLGSAALIMMFSEFYFTLYAKVTDIYNLLGHIYKVIAYGIVYQAVFVISVREPYELVQRLQMQHEKLANQLRESQKIAHLGQWEFEFSSRKVTWSEGVYELFELESAQFGASYESFLLACHPDDRQKIDDNFTTSVKLKLPYEFVHRLLMKDGRIKWVRELGVTEYDADGQPKHTKGVVMEITKIIKMEESLRESELHYRTIAESLPVPLAVNDLEGKVTFLNKSFTETFGYSLADFSHISQWWPLAYPDPVYREKVSNDWRIRAEKISQGEFVPPVEANVTCKNGLVRAVISSAVQFSPKEHMVYLYDISELKRAEKNTHELREQLAQATKMEAIGHLTAGVAHDFNNMLGAIMGYGELSQHMLAAGNIDKVAYYQGEILKAGNRAKELILQMLTFSRLSPEGNEKSIPVVGLTMIVKEVVSLLRSSIPRTIDLNYNIEVDGLRVQVQPVQLHQIILNLGVNARDAMGEYGRIDITLGMEHVERTLCHSCNKEFSGDFAKISVKDSGSGIPEQIIKKVFDPFFTTKGVGKGTGMGLSVVHGLVHALGGHIQILSGTNIGTEISILLPLDNSTIQTDLLAEQSLPVNIQGARIMVVDDEKAMLAMLHESLSAHGAEVLSFDDPVLALGEFALHQNQIDLVITDESMPGLSGIALTASLLAIKPTLPIILCTGYSDHANPEIAVQVGIKGFFYKPLVMVELLRKIDELLKVKKD